MNKIAKEERNRGRLLEDRQRVEEELRNAGQDLESAIKLNASTVADYEKEMRRLENKEDNLKKQINDLRKQIGEERTQLNNLINRISSEAEDFALNKIQSEQKKIYWLRPILNLK
ncbi:hypothetical protein BpHYR1_027284 [Brachionus plicatilis]|uniref:Uncharacterized protein n=1 Tax=Brachionus plicatilis TaxID=10195 RepID=A0A3M7PCV5_BRAPC|nr:hypothetical protein BpHYR1_027284 [Brachionus plicatilis]